jgi:hypothetical protein
VSWQADRVRPEDLTLLSAGREDSTVVEGLVDSDAPTLGVSESRHLAPMTAKS